MSLKYSFEVQSLFFLYNVFQALFFILSLFFTHLFLFLFLLPRSHSQEGQTYKTNWVSRVSKIIWMGLIMKVMYGNKVVNNGF